MVFTAAVLSLCAIYLESSDGSDAESEVSYSGTCGTNAAYSFDPLTGTLTISGTGSMDDYDSGYEREAAPWYSFRSDVKMLIIGDDITSVGDFAFYYCTSLASVTIGSGVESIGSCAFCVCISLASVNIPDSVTEIGDYAFSECESLISVNIPSSVTSIECYAFDYCTSLTSVVIPDSVTSIEHHTFSECESLVSVTMPDSVTSIEYGAFRYCTSLTSVTIPESVTYIGDYAFFECTSMTQIVFGTGITEIDSEAFPGFVFFDTDGTTPIDVSADNMRGSTFAGEQIRMVKQEAVSDGAWSSVEIMGVAFAAIISAAVMGAVFLTVKKY
ncbi:MAG: hypothetical protein A3Q59_03360 [Methanomethylophilus alvi]|nr:MAG: hypothetical protein A3Q59_03360 [Methanomethylophilus alvi]